MANGKKKVLVAAPVHEVLLNGLEGLGYECHVHENITQAAAPDLIKDCAGVITSTRLQLDAALIDCAPELEWIGRMGSGMEVIDVAYATGKCIQYFGSPEGNSNAVGEHCLGMLLDLIRRIAVSREEIKNGLWLREENRGIELEGKTIGIIGFGHTGPAFAKKLKGFDIQVLVYDNRQQDIPAPFISCTSLEQIFEQATIVSFHVPQQPDTRHYVDKSFIDKMKQKFILLNTSRGNVVDTHAVYDALLSGKITGACLDVWEQEPMKSMDRGMRELLDKMTAMPNTVITPHIAGYTYEALYKMSAILLKKIQNRMLKI